MWTKESEPLAYRVTYDDGKSRIGRAVTLHLVGGSVHSLAQPPHSARLVDVVIE
jgi:hypothetical protein